MAAMAIFSRSRKALLKTTLNQDSIKSITTATFLSQETQLAESLPPPPPPPATPLPQNPASGSPLYNENWRNPIPTSSPSPTSQSIIPLGFINQTAVHRLQALAKTLDLQTILNVFADWTATQRWADMKQLFEIWIRFLDRYGEPNKPNVSLYNHYLRANLMMAASAAQLLDLVAQMEDYRLTPNTASFNLVLKAMDHAKEAEAAEKLLERMIQSGKESKESLPDDESYALVVGMLLHANEVDAALKYIDLNLKSGYMLSMNVFNECVRSCVNKGRLDTLVSIIERCKKIDQNKALCPPWNTCIHIADDAMQADHSELAYYSLEFMAKWIATSELARPPVHLFVDEGLLISAVGTAGRTYSTKLLDGAWSILKRSLRKKVPNPESYIAKICAHASLGNLQKAFSTLHEFEAAYGNTEEELFSPFSTLHPLVVACSKNGFVTLDSVYYQLENLSRADPPYKSVAALNCIILGCANIWDVNRAFQTFEAINTAFGLTPDINSYNGLICAFGKLNKREEAVKVFEHFKGVGVEPNAVTFSLLVDAHLLARDPRAALSVINEMVNSGFVPSKEMLKKVRRRCIREIDNDSDEQVNSLARKFNIRMGTENRRDMLFNLQFSADYA